VWRRRCSSNSPGLEPLLYPLMPFLHPAQHLYPGVGEAVVGALLEPITLHLPPLPVLRVGLELGLQLELELELDLSLTTRDVVPLRALGQQHHALPLLLPQPLQEHRR
jgi:hypothetical protein